MVVSFALSEARNLGFFKSRKSGIISTVFTERRGRGGDSTIAIWLADARCV